MSAAESPTVALFRGNFLPYSETFIFDQIRHHERYRVLVLARRHFNARRFPVEDIATIERETAPRPLAKAWFDWSGRSPVLERAIERARPRVLHAHFGHNATFCLKLAQRFRLPLIVSLHGRDVAVPLSAERRAPAWWHYTLRLRELFRQAALFLCASQDLAELWKQAGCPAEKILIHRLGIDLQAFRPLEQVSSPGILQVLHIGRFVEKKGGVFVIRAAARARDAGLPFHLTLVGDGPLRADYERLVRELALDSQVTFTGALAHDEVLHRLQRAAVLLAPSVVAHNLDRDSGLVVAKEAAACGVPVIGTRHGGIPDIIDDESTGFLVAERDLEALSERLMRVLGDAELRARLGVCARAKMEREYDIRERVRELELIYDRVAHA
jgi:glycosyltransferase involved in cell wall biosynthesis